jgi:hypothetical protein
VPIFFISLEAFFFLLHYCKDILFFYFLSHIFLLVKNTYKNPYSLNPVNILTFSLDQPIESHELNDSAHELNRFSSWDSNIFELNLLTHLIQKYSRLKMNRARALGDTSFR